MFRLEHLRILVLSPHTDDAELGAGGVMARAIREGATVHVAVFSSAVESLPPGSAPDRLATEFKESMRVFGLKEDQFRLFDYPVRRLSHHRQEVLENLVQLRREVQPHLVLLPASTDVHQDHQVLHNEGLRAFKDVSILGYELPWNHLSFHAQCFIAIQPEDLQRKIAALASYESQVELKRPYFREDFLTGLALVRGTQCKVPMAEAFEVTRIHT